MRTQAVWAGRIFQGVWPPIIFGVGFLALWQWFVEVRDIKPFVLPKPSAIFEQLRLQHDTILTADIRPDQSQVAVGSPSRAANWGCVRPVATR